MMLWRYAMCDNMYIFPHWVLQYDLPCIPNPHWLYLAWFASLLLMTFFLNCLFVCLFVIITNLDFGVKVVIKSANISMRF